MTFYMVFDAFNGFYDLKNIYLDTKFILLAHLRAKIHFNVFRDSRGCPKPFLVLVSVSGCGADNSPSIRCSGDTHSLVYRNIDRRDVFAMVSWY